MLAQSTGIPPSAHHFQARPSRDSTLFPILFVLLSSQRSRFYSSGGRASPEARGLRDRGYGLGGARHLASCSQW